MSKSVGKRSKGRRQAVSIWNVFLPSDLNREDYIRNCYRTFSVSLINENAEIVHGVPVGKLAIQMINFPETYNQAGSSVLCGYLAFKDTIAVLDVFDFDNYEGIEENQFKVTKSTPQSSSEVVLDGGNGISSLSAHSKKGKAIVNLLASDKDKTAEVNINSNGTVNINSNKGIIAKDNTLFELEVYDGVADNKKSTIKASRTTVDVIGNDKVNIGSGKEPIPLGDTLAKLLKDLIQEISISQTNAGPLLNSAKIAAYIQQVDTILSKYGFTQ